MMFDEKKKMDNVLMGELLPYLLKLDEARDGRTAIECERYGQFPISNDSKYDAVTAYWRERNAKWSMQEVETSRLPIDNAIDIQEGSTNSSSKQETEMQNIREILSKEASNIDTMRGLN
ncbi:hypothetical protein L7F22_037121 [Adiantum nelumboides]|nr:hypothetical protein [Adiantum nelumboides]